MKIFHKRALIMKTHASPELSQGNLAAWVKTTYKLRSAPARNTVSNILKNAAAILSDKYGDENPSSVSADPYAVDQLQAMRWSNKKSVERIPSRTVSGTQTYATWSPRSKRATPLSATLSARALIPGIVRQQVQEEEEEKYLCPLEEENIECADASDGEVESDGSGSQAEVLKYNVDKLAGICCVTITTLESVCPVVPFILKNMCTVICIVDSTNDTTVIYLNTDA
ncbi:unnamed protein product [Phytophthora fragariaefolia]|uniref:Unnamed protein product n=1 Tax=Phytophthora fragariaefolia TaxID=1490495 RepID=A0A9W7CW70_9STRA|nr:unnamed protein product [Phytophthora fragariaefolia]